MRRRSILLAALAVFAMAFATTTASAESSRKPAADFTIKDIDGKRVRLSELKGRVVVVNFWATWCRPCLQELPFLEKFHGGLEKKGLSVLAVATDGPETAARVRSVARQKKWTMPVIHDADGRLIAQLNPRGNNPFTVFIDKQGRIAYEHEGYASGDEKKYLAIIKKLLRE